MYLRRGQTAYDKKKHCSDPGCTWGAQNNALEGAHPFKPSKGMKQKTGELETNVRQESGTN